MGGASIFRIMDQDPNLSVVLETLTDGGREQIMGQVYLPEIVDGDKRILLVNGEPVPYALARIPSAGETRGNLAAGGHGEGRPLTDRDRWIAEQVGPELKRRRASICGHRCHRRLPDRDQCHLSYLYSRTGSAIRARHCWRLNRYLSSTT